jgi:hypothetical protein
MASPRLLNAPVTRISGRTGAGLPGTGIVDDAFTDKRLMGDDPFRSSRPVESVSVDLAMNALRRCLRRLLPVDLCLAVRVGLPQTPIVDVKP